MCWRLFTFHMFVVFSFFVTFCIVWFDFENAMLRTFCMLHLVFKLAHKLISSCGVFASKRFPCVVCFIFDRILYRYLCRAYHMLHFFYSLYVLKGCSRFIGFICFYVLNRYYVWNALYAFPECIRRWLLCFVPNVSFQCQHRVDLVCVLCG